MFQDFFLKQSHPCTQGGQAYSAWFSVVGKWGERSEKNDGQEKKANKTGGASELHFSNWHVTRLFEEEHRRGGGRVCRRWPRPTEAVQRWLMISAKPRCPSWAKRSSLGNSPTNSLAVSSLRTRRWAVGVEWMGELGGVEWQWMHLKWTSEGVLLKVHAGYLSGPSSAINQVSLESPKEAIACPCFLPNLTFWPNQRGLIPCRWASGRKHRI